MFSKHRGNWLRVLLGTISAVALSHLNGGITSAQAAETVVVRLGILEESISVADLRLIAKTGKVPDYLKSYTKRLSPAQRTALLAALRTRIPISIVTINNLLNNRIGNAILSDLATATPREDNAGVQALRAALLLGAIAPEGFSILSFIEAYPSQRLNINLAQAFQVVGTLNTSFWQTQRFMAAIAPRLSASRPNLKLPLDPIQPGTAKVEVLKLNLNDQQRVRQIPVDVYWSTSTSIDKPVILFSHGLGSVRTEMRYLAEHLASYGYAVVALEHPGSNEANTNLAAQGKVPLLRSKEVLERPQDISFVLDKLAKLNSTADNPLQGKLATDKAMVIGYSYGGSTSLLLSGAELQLEGLKKRCQNNVAALSLGEGIQCVAQGLPENRYKARDVRIKSAISLNPTASLLFGDTGLSQIEIPTLIFTASADKTTPALQEQIAGFDQIPTPKWLAGIVGATHLSIKDPSTTLEQATRPRTLYSGDEVVGDKAVDIRNYIKAISLAMAFQLTPEADTYNIFLTPQYALYASTPAFPVRLITEIPPDAKAIVKEYMQVRTQ